MKNRMIALYNYLSSSNDYCLQDCDCGGTIQRDIHRTFPAHDFFKEAGGVGQDNLFHLTKAYAVYDTEVGYCQGLTFLAATLLLHVRFLFVLIKII